MTRTHSFSFVRNYIFFIYFYIYYLIFLNLCVKSCINSVIFLFLFFFTFDKVIQRSLCLLQFPRIFLSHNPFCFSLVFAFLRSTENDCGKALFARMYYTLDIYTLATYMGVLQIVLMYIKEKNNKHFLKLV